MKKIVLFMSILLFIGGCSSVSNKITVPDVIGVDLETAKTTLTNNDLIPAIVYGYSDTVEKGNVISVNPAVGAKVPKNQKVTITISKGPEFIFATNSTISWYHVRGSSGDDWEFYNPEINDEKLIISVKPTINTIYSFEWLMFGTASLTEIFTKTAPVEMIVGDEEGYYTIKVSLESLGEEKPTTVYVHLASKIGGKQEDVKIEFSISW